MQDSDNTQQTERRSKAVSAMEFADLIGVNKSTVSRAMKSKRLEHSLVEEDGQTKILVYQGCVEWHMRKQIEKDRYAKDEHDVAASKARHEYYRSFLTKLEYEVKTAQYIPFKEVGQAGAEIVLEAKQYLLDSRYKHALKLLPIADAFDMEKAIKERDHEFLKTLAKLKEVGKQVAEDSSAIRKEPDETST